MNDAEYKATQYQIINMAAMVRLLDLDGFLERISKAEALGPILDPTMFLQAHKNMDDIKWLATGLRAFQREVQKIAGKGAA